MRRGRSLVYLVLAVTSAVSLAAVAWVSESDGDHAAPVLVQRGRACPAGFHNRLLVGFSGGDGAVRKYWLNAHRLCDGAEVSLPPEFAALRGRNIDGISGSRGSFAFVDGSGDFDRASVLVGGASVDIDRSELGTYMPAPRRDGVVAYISRGEQDILELRVRSTGGQVRQVYRSKVGLLDPVWLPNGQIAVLESGKNWAAILLTNPAATRIVTRLAIARPDASALIAYGDRFVVEDYSGAPNEAVALLDSAGKVVRLLPRRIERILAPWNGGLLAGDRAGHVYYLTGPRLEHSILLSKLAGPRVWGGVVV